MSLIARLARLEAQRPSPPTPDPVAALSDEALLAETHAIVEAARARAGLPPLPRPQTWDERHALIAAAARLLEAP